jgi:hypothetical protein
MTSTAKVLVRSFNSSGVTNFARASAEPKTNSQEVATFIVHGREVMQILRPPELQKADNLRS